MRTIEIDNETYAFLQANAKPFEETPGDVVKRLLGIKSEIKTNNLIVRQTTNDKSRQKQRKVSLPELINDGYIQNGEKLLFQDSRGNKYPEYEITLSNSQVVWKKNTYSMSDLAQTLLKRHGYQSTAVRGPLFFLTEKGKSIKELWDDYLKK